MLYRTLAAAAATIFPFAFSQKIISLVGDDWTVSNPELNVSVPAHLPSQAHLDLYANQVIGDPYYGLNDFNLRWVAWSNWTYTSEPIVGLSSNASSTWLQFDGLDTFTSIEFCGKHVASTNNQFRQYWFDVSSILSSCPAEEDRVLSINFGSAPKIANAIANEPDQKTWPDGVQIQFEFLNRWFIRKEQSDFGWDWGPAFAPAGPWKPAYVVQLAEEQIQVRNTLVDIYRQGQLPLTIPDQSQPWIVNASMDYYGDLPSGAELRYTLTDMKNNTIYCGDLTDVNSTDSTITGQTIIPNGAVDLWWPNGMGEQNLYYIAIEVMSPSNRSIASVSKRVGFRTIVLNEYPISDAQLAQGIAAGNNWHFEINGHEFYAKGSNFIPPDAFWPRVTPERIDTLFDSVVEGNQNMLRVWSSGAYSPDFMYDSADVRGILLWSEFEFGDALYPVNPEFLANVADEARYQVRRVNHHPSLALWAGGNELENLELDLVNESAPEEYPKYLKQYETVFLDTLLPAVFENTRSISYTPSSTSNGWQSLNFSNPIPIVERYNNLTSGYIYGETDFYNYDPSVLYNDSAYPVGRFSNEFGYHSMPSLQSWRSQISAADLYFNSSTVMLRDHHPPAEGLNTSNFANASIGQAQMTGAVELWYPVPNKTDSVANFSAWCHATQIFQADLDSVLPQGFRSTGKLGSLYWQLEDIWVAPSWAGVEYDGRWKILHYAAKDAYQPVVISPYYDMTTGNLSALVTSDLWDPASGTAKFQWFDWEGNRLPINTSSSVDFNIGPINSTKVLQTFTNDILGDYNPENVVLRMQVEAEGKLPNTNSTPKTGVAAWVWLDYPAGAVVAFDSNGFWLGANCSREIGYKVKSDSTDGKWLEGVTVQSLYNQTLPY
ncbi:hypothetical protein D0861_00251 [Hortaea werneckii]|uniref:Beta-mannosidase A n=1 Tax=Hortaea werneckii TaxID=91943 RepID=A0A3M7G554_HORWE|nr:hypothetical protein D0861_00251 [Hortaea werneckii]